MDKRLLSRIPRIFLAAIVMGGALWWIEQYAAPLRTGSIFWDYSVVAAVCALGIVIYFSSAMALRAFGMADIKDAFRKGG